MTQPSPAEPPRVRTARRAYRGLAVVFALAIATQVLLAGLSIFVDAGWWSLHRTLGHAVGWLILLAMIALTFAGRLPGRPRRLAITALALNFLQGATGAIGGAVGVIHPVNALLLFWIALLMARPVATHPSGRLAFAAAEM